MNFNGISDIRLKGCPKREKLRGNGNSFHEHFCNDFSIFHIFPIEEMYHKYWEKSKFYKKESNYSQANCLHSKCVK
jgi:hypothetical protein